MNDLPALREPNSLRDAMLDAAKHAAAKAIACGREGLKVEIKPDGSRVTNGDRNAQAEILNRLMAYGQQQEPGVEFRFLAEEKIDDEMKRRVPGIEALSDTPDEWDAKHRQGFYWVIDPIDGTGNYSQIYTDKPELNRSWAVSIALQHNGRTVAAALYEAIPGEHEAQTDEHGNISGLKGKLYWAEDHLHANGKGAYEIDCATGIARQLKCEPQVEAVAGMTGYIEHFVPDSDAAHQPPTQKIEGRLFESQKQAFDAHGLAVDDARSACAAALQVAAGKNHEGKSIGAFSHGFACPWDWAATSLVLEQAGVPVLIADAGESTVNPDAPPLAILLAARNQNLMRDMMENYQHTLQDYYPERPASGCQMAANLSGVSEKIKPSVQQRQASGLY